MTTLLFAVGGVAVGVCAIASMIIVGQGGPVRYRQPGLVPWLDRLSDRRRSSGQILGYYGA